MLRLTLRTLLAYLDDTLGPVDARHMGLRVAENPTAQDLVERIRRVSRRRGLSTPPAGGDGGLSDPNTVAEYLSDALTGDKLTEFEQACLEQDVYLAEVAATHQILTMVLSEPVRVPPTARKRMYQLVKGKESVPDRKPGDTAPVGGRFEEEKPGDSTDDSDAPLLLGLGSHPKARTPGRAAAFALTAAGLAATFLAAAWMALPPDARTPVEAETSVALAPAPKPQPGPTLEPAKEKEPAAEPKKEPTSEPGKEPTPEPKKEPVPGPKPEPVTPPEPKKEPAADLVPAAQPPKADKGPVGRLERPASVVVLVKPADGDTWTRVAAVDPVVPTAQQAVSLPGYRSGVKLDSGVQVDLWGNLPDLLAAPLLASGVTFHAPYEGFDADLTVRAGRVYVAAKKPGGGKVRLRFADQVWDVTLADEKTDVAFELVRALARGERPEPPQVRAELAVLAGSAGLKAGYKELPKLGVGDYVLWDGKGKGLEGPKKLDPAAGGKAAGYFSRFPLTSEEGRRVNAALDELSKRLSDPGRAKVVIAEMLQGRADPSAVAAARVGVYAAAAVGDWAGLVDAINDAGRPYVRVAAVDAVRWALANDPEGEKEFRRLLAERERLTDGQFDATLRMLRGYTDAEKKKPETIDQLVAALDAPAVVLRELAIMNLLTDVATDARSTPALTKFDAGGPADAREAAVKAWKRYAEEWKRKLQPPPGGE